MDINTALTEIRKEAIALMRMLNKVRAGKIVPQLAMRYIASQGSLVSEYAEELKKAITDWVVVPVERKKRVKKSDAGASSSAANGPTPGTDSGQQSHTAAKDRTRQRQ